MPWSLRLPRSSAWTSATCAAAGAGRRRSHLPVRSPCILPLSFSEIGTVFARDRSTVAHACGLVEDQRDDPIFDAKLDYLERAVIALLGALSLPRSCR